MPDQKHLSMHPHRYPGIPDIIFLTVRIREAQAVHFRTRRLPDGYSYEDMQLVAERMAIERFPGLIHMQLALPIGDNGHAFALP